MKGYVVLLEGLNHDEPTLYEIQDVEDRDTMEYDEKHGYGYLALSVKWKRDPDD